MRAPISSSDRSNSQNERLWNGEAVLSVTPPRGGRHLAYCDIGYQSFWVVNEDATAQHFVWNEVKQRIDELAVVWHKHGIEQAGMRPIRSPNDTVGCNFQEAMCKWHYVGIGGTNPRDAVSAAEFHPHVIAMH
jgi:hypothetical protein